MIGNDWDVVLKDTFETEWYKRFENNIDKLYEETIVFPDKNDIFRALKLVPFSDVKVVILGQDPYHGDGEANGLAFSVNNGIKMPPSLKNIFKELKSDTGIERNDTDLRDWAEQGVLLLNTVLTVEKDKPLSHNNMGWEVLTDEIIKKLNDRDESIIFVLWGEKANKKADFITNSNHDIISSSHPSPFSARKSFFESKVFSRINEKLYSNNKKTIRF